MKTKYRKQISFDDLSKEDIDQAKLSDDNETDDIIDL